VLVGSIVERGAFYGRIDVKKKIIEGAFNYKEKFNLNKLLANFNYKLSCSS
jgi:hypothetical protein